MNNIVFYNIIREMDRKIEKDKAETIEILKDGYQCIADCYLRNRGLCHRHEQCEWDLRSEFYKKPHLIEI